MGNYAQHNRDGFIVMLVFFAILWFTGFPQSKIWVVAGILIGVNIPDIVEPAKHYTHRKYFHSVRFMKIVLIILGVSFLIGFLWTPSWFFSALSIGYLTHLGNDATTKMGLPK